MVSLLLVRDFVNGLLDYLRDQLLHDVALEIYVSLIQGSDAIRFRRPPFRLLLTLVFGTLLR